MFSFSSRFLQYPLHFVFVVGICSVVALFLADESLKVPGSQLGWSVGMEIISFICVIGTLSTVVFDRIRTRKAGKLMRKSIDLSLIHSPSDNSFTSLSSVSRTSTLADLPIDDTEL